MTSKNNFGLTGGTGEILVAPSILSADFSRLEQEVASVAEAGADLIHVDVMDGHFVPNLTIGAGVVASLSRRSVLPLDVHLMIERPWLLLDDFIKAGAWLVTVHQETCPDEKVREILDRLKQAKVKTGISINPGTPGETLEKYLDEADLILLMSVNPGFGGQAFMPEVLPKLAALRKRFSGLIQIDGGINAETAGVAVKAGADVLVSGSYIFSSADRRQAIAGLKKCTR